MRGASVQQVEHYVARMEKFCQGIFHLDDVSHRPLLLHKYKPMLSVYSKGTSINIGNLEDKSPITIDKARKSIL